MELIKNLFLQLILYVTWKIYFINIYNQIEFMYD